ncbi:MAG: FecCD family ABC transporter permease [Candidatus Thalassarchaeaceae archaeon]|tara:strand:- start:155 stop:1192 length:1038 start_codon:yes stop_codon:yes gene_type:complete
MDSISEKHVRDSRIQGTIIAILFAGTLASAIIAIGLGSSSTLDPISTIKIILGLEEGSDLQTVIIWELRFPRVLMAIIGGAALGTAGALMQGCLGSPLVSPLTLGVASGSALGAAFSIILGFSVISEVSVVAIAFLFSLAVVAIITKLGNMRSVSSESYILVGIAITFISGAIVSTFTYFATGAQLSQLANWSYGSLSRPSLTEVIWVSAAIICLMPSAMKWAWDLNTLSLGGDDFAISSGVNPSSTRRNILILSALMTSLVIAFTGLIGFVGLAAPHMGRLVIGNDYRKLIPCSAVLGSLLMLFADTAGRTLFTPVIIPVGMIMAIIGGPLFVYLLLRNREVAI